MHSGRVVERRLPDPWETKCPKAADLSPRDLVRLLDVHDQVETLTGWEQGFCGSLFYQMCMGRGISLRQEEVLDRGLLKKLWMGDPNLWGDPLPPTPLAQIIPSPSLRARYQTQRRMIERAQFLRLDELETMLLKGLRQLEKLLDAGSTVPPF